MMKHVQWLSFGERVAGYDTPVLNEREVRAAAGILFVAMFLALMLVLFRQDFLLIKYVLVGFLTDFSVRVLINPRFSPTLIVGRLIVGRQPPEYTGAPQKRFAWSIGLVLSSVMFLLLVVGNSYSILTGITCLVCLSFLFFETAFGICIGCVVYRWFHKDARYCAGGLCEQTKKGTLQHTSLAQWLILFSFIGLFSITVLLFHDQFRVPPKKLWEDKRPEAKHPVAAERQPPI